MTTSRDSIEVAAIVFAESKGAGTFTANEFTGFLEMAGVEMEEGAADDILAEMVERNALRQIGPGRYAAAARRECVDASLQSPLAPEEPADGSFIK